MTLKTEIPISIEHKIHRVYHQHHHHHHYHLHHILDHHHLHIHNQSVFRSHVQSQRLHNGAQARPLSTQSTPPAIRNSRSDGDDDDDDEEEEEDDRDDNDNEAELIAQRNERRLRNDRIVQQLAQTRGLAHVIGAHNHSEEQLRQQQQQPKSFINNSAHGKQSNYANSTKSKQRSQIHFLLLSAFAYILSPIDIIPEAIFGIFGILDDLVFLIMCLFCVAIILFYPLFREMRRTLFDKLGLKQQCSSIDNKVA